MTTSAFHVNSPDSATAAGTAPETPAERPNAILRGIFAVDRAVCALSVVALVAGSVLVAEVLGWPTLVVAAIGAALAPYALLLHYIHRSGLHRSALAKLTAAGDAAWVIASAALVLGWPDATSTGGKWLIVGIAAVIADIGFTKVYGWSKTDR